MEEDFWLAPSGRPRYKSYSMKTIDRVFKWLLVLGAILRSVGSVVARRGNPGVLVWAPNRPNVMRAVCFVSGEHLVARRAAPGRLDLRRCT